jgi:hypothetical protein
VRVLPQPLASHPGPVTPAGHWAEAGHRASRYAAWKVVFRKPSRQASGSLAVQTAAYGRGVIVARPYYRGRVNSCFPPEGEDPVRVRTEIQWRNATATVTIPEVFFYSTGIYFPVEYRTIAVLPPPRRETPEDRRREADEATEQMRARVRLPSLIRVNGGPVRGIHGESVDRGFTVWIWSAFPAHPDGQTANAALIQLNSPEFPGADATVPSPAPGSATAPVSHEIVRTYFPPQGEDPVVVRPGIRWQNPTATVTIPEVFFYSTGVYIPVTCQTLPARPSARPAETKEEEERETAQSFSRMRTLQPLVQQITVNGIRAEPRTFRSNNHWFTFTAWIWIEAGGPHDALHIQLNRPEFPGAVATFPYPPAGSVTAPAASVPQSWDERGNNWARTTTVLRSSGPGSGITGEPPEE